MFKYPLPRLFAMISTISEYLFPDMLNVKRGKLDVCVRSDRSANVCQVRNIEKAIVGMAALTST